MKDEAPSILPLIGFAVTAILAARIVVIYNLRLWRAAKKLKHAYANGGREWDYMSDLPFRLRLFSQPESIREASDSTDVKEAKEGLITCRVGARDAIWKAVKIMLWGSGGTILLAILESGVRHFL